MGSGYGDRQCDVIKSVSIAGGQQSLVLKKWKPTGGHLARRLCAGQIDMILGLLYSMGISLERKETTEFLG